MVGGARPIVALYDANVLYPAPLRDLLIRVARAGLVGARWTARIHDEWMGSLLARRPDLSRAQLERTRELVDAAAPGALVEDFEHRIPDLTLPDPDDRHVLAAAIEGEADVIVTFNQKDFPGPALQPHGIEAVDPNSFLMSLLAVHPEVVSAALRAQRTSLRKPPRTVDEFLADLRDCGLARFVQAVRTVGVEL